ncbi:CocE/NonD family hydrolase [Dyadobacter sp. 676]|uniref:CocE/NonD family hydrolase n=1 Tax=Dyadobacter sp. 676 TaxID=3088362 RepID=A0AAU8FME4_9BACT
MLLVLVLMVAANTLAQTGTKEDSLYIRRHYTKIERQIPMRDGVKLFTSIYLPKDITKSKAYPILLNRTPYSVAPYGEDSYKTALGPGMLFASEGYIIVYQDVKGEFMSEGYFEAYRPSIPVKKSKTDIDESSDDYNTIEWLIKNIEGNNGKVGTWGISAPGYYATMTAVEAHPCIENRFTAGTGYRLVHGRRPAPQRRILPDGYIRIPFRRTARRGRSLPRKVHLSSQPMEHRIPMNFTRK